MIFQKWKTQKTVTHLTDKWTSKKTLCGTNVSPYWVETTCKLFLCERCKQSVKARIKKMLNEID